jgi:hypothetical protein
MRGRPAQPLELLKLKGATKKNPGRYRERMQETVDTRSVGDPPAEFLNPHSQMSIDLLAIWNGLLADAPKGCITRRQRTSLKNACLLQYEIDSKRGTPAMHNMMLRYLTSFGMSGEAKAGAGGKDAPPPGESEESGWKAFAREDKASRAG